VCLVIETRTFSGADLNSCDGSGSHRNGDGDKTGNGSGNTHSGGTNGNGGDNSGSGTGKTVGIVISVIAVFGILGGFIFWYRKSMELTEAFHN
jgi:hypothetical protein